MKIDVTQELLDLDGEPMRISFQACPMCGRLMEEEGLRTLRNACTSALGEDYQDEQRSGGASADEKFKRHCLAVKVHSNDEPDLTVEELALLKKMVAKRWPSRIMGPAWELLDPKDE